MVNLKTNYQTMDSAPMDGSVVLAWRYYPVAIQWNSDPEDTGFPWNGLQLNGLFALQTNGFAVDDTALVAWFKLPNEAAFDKSMKTAPTDGTVILAWRHRPVAMQFKNNWIAMYWDTTNNERPFWKAMRLDAPLSNDSEELSDNDPTLEGWIDLQWQDPETYTLAMQKMPKNGDVVLVWKNQPIAMRYVGKIGREGRELFHAISLDRRHDYEKFCFSSFDQEFTGWRALPV